MELVLDSVRNSHSGKGGGGTGCREGGGGFLGCSLSWRVGVRQFPGKRIYVVWTLDNYGLSLNFYGKGM